MISFSLYQGLKKHPRWGWKPQRKSEWHERYTGSGGAKPGGTTRSAQMPFTACGRSGDDLVETGPVLNSLIPSGGKSNQNEPIYRFTICGALRGIPVGKGCRKTQLCCGCSRGKAFPPKIINLQKSSPGI